MIDALVAGAPIMLIAPIAPMLEDEDEDEEEPLVFTVFFGAGKCVRKRSPIFIFVSCSLFYRCRYVFLVNSYRRISVSFSLLSLLHF